MMRKFYIISMWFLCFLFSSCSCKRVLTGILVDRQTMNPISAATIQVTNKGYERHFSSDSTGFFKAYVQGRSKCPRIRAHITADGYSPINAIEPRGRDTLILYMDQKIR